MSLYRTKTQALYNMYRIAGITSLISGMSFFTKVTLFNTDENNVYILQSNLYIEGTLKGTWKCCPSYIG